jgi:hypothetical protein
MSPEDRIVAIEGALFAELVKVLDGALRGKRRALARLAAREGVEPGNALEELGAFPSSSCAALEEGAGLRPALCTAGVTCPVADECPLVDESGAESLGSSDLASLVASLLRCGLRPMPPCPLEELGAFRAPIEELLARSPRVAADGPPRARTSLTLLDLAGRRGGLVGAAKVFLAPGEVESVAAFVPPGSSRGEPRLVAVESWLRRAAIAEVALVEGLSAPRARER